MLALSAITGIVVSVLAVFKIAIKGNEQHKTVINEKEYDLLTYCPDSGYSIRK